MRTSWWREPLVHFLVLGALLFLVGAVAGERSDPASRKVVVSAGEIESLAATFRATWRREPTAEELEGLVEDWTKEELYYREAVAMGLDRNDSVVRRRMHQKLEFLAGDLAGTAEPTEDDLAAWLAAHPGDYTSGARFDLLQVFVGDEEGRAAVALASLRSGADAEGMTDPLHVPKSWIDASAFALAATFGPGFADALATLPLGTWEGPVASGYGQHLVRIDRRVDGAVQPLSDVRHAVRRDLLADRRAGAEQAFYDTLRARYTIFVAWPGAER